MAKIKHALISVSDKTGLIPFVKTLVECGVEIISTGGTAQILRKEGIPVTEVSQLTGFPEIFNGRVKTLHPVIHGGILFLRDHPDHKQLAEKLNIRQIDLVVVNFYPFEQTITRSSTTLEEALENIDIGGPSMVRSAAKNFPWVTVVVDPSDYDRVAEQIRATGETTFELRRELATKAFALTAKYDAAICNYLSQSDQDSLPNVFHLAIKKAQRLRYGENPHQTAALYGDFHNHFEQLHGRELSYNNILDISAATMLIREFLNDPPTVAIVKHTNPCGVGQAPTLLEAWEKAFATDNQAPFGGIIITNVPMDGPCAKAIAEIFTEVIIAPQFDKEALAVLTNKKNLRLITFKPSIQHNNWVEIRAVGFGSYLVQTPDTSIEMPPHWRVVTKRAPTEQELQAMAFGWRVVKHVRSNAVVFSAEDRTLGIGAGQMSRVDACKLAIWKARQAGLALENSVVCSDAFFPFPDSVIAAAEAGATAVIQPGGSIRDPEVIEAANARNLAMVFTGVRHFKH